MVWQKISGKTLVDAMRIAGTSEKKIEEFRENSFRYNRSYDLAVDSAFTAISDGENLGVAKRTTYYPIRDKDKIGVGIVIALFRMLKKENQKALDDKINA